jgi:response regulator RpfG family c-di-GMP phosphodiesterase
MSNKDELLFADENIEEKIVTQQGWKILIADDEPDVHAVTRMVLSDLHFEGKGVIFQSAYSRAETLEMLKKNNDIALILLDVVMEEDDSGLKIVKQIRETLKNKLIRIILRTGQPGKAPEKSVILDYDINDYKEKTELTFQKLFTTVIASLRAYQDLKTIERSRKGLEQIVKSSATLFELRSLKNFANGVLTQLTSLLGFDEDSLYIHSSGFAVTQTNGEFKILAGTGDYENFVDKPLKKSVSEDVYSLLLEAINGKKSILTNDLYIGFFETHNGSTNLLYLKGKHKLSEIDRELLEIFSTNVAVAFDNLFLNRELEETQKEVIFTLGEVVESRAHDIGNHVKRVAAYAELLARKINLTNEDIELIKLAAPMHDIGKIAIPDAILNKPAKLTEDEFAIIQQHSMIGHGILKSSNRKILDTASKIALEHHERWDGCGYPNGLKGEEISIFSRITGLVDIFDALLHKRIYKERWNRNDVVDFIASQNGRRFDPKLVEVFLANIEEFYDICEAFPDEL